MLCIEDKGGGRSEGIADIASLMDQEVVEPWCNLYNQASRCVAIPSPVVCLFIDIGVFGSEVR